MALAVSAKNISRHPIRMPAVFLCKQCVSDSGRAIRQVDDTAAGKTLFGNSALHDFVVLMGIDAKMIASLLAKSNCRCQYAAGTIARDSVDRAI